MVGSVANALALLSKLLANANINVDVKRDIQVVNDNILTAEIAWNERFSSLEKQIASINSECLAIQFINDQFQKDVSPSLNVAALESELESLKVRVSVYDGNYASLQRHCERIEQRNNELQEELKNARSVTPEIVKQASDTNNSIIPVENKNSVELEAFKAIESENEELIEKAFIREEVINELKCDIERQKGDIDRVIGLTIKLTNDNFRFVKALKLIAAAEIETLPQLSEMLLLGGSEEITVLRQEIVSLDNTRIQLLRAINLLKADVRRQAGVITQLKGVITEREAENVKQQESFEEEKKKLEENLALANKEKRKAVQRSLTCSKSPSTGSSQDAGCARCANYHAVNHRDAASPTKSMAFAKQHPKTLISNEKDGEEHETQQKIGSSDSMSLRENNMALNSTVRSLKRELEVLKLEHGILRESEKAAQKRADTASNNAAAAALQIESFEEKLSETGSPQILKKKLGEMQQKCVKAEGALEGAIKLARSRLQALSSSRLEVAELRGLLQDHGVEVSEIEYTDNDEDAIEAFEVSVEGSFSHWGRNRERVVLMKELEGYKLQTSLLKREIARLCDIAGCGLDDGDAVEIPNRKELMARHELEEVRAELARISADFDAALNDAKLGRKFKLDARAAKLALVESEAKIARINDESNVKILKLQKEADAKLNDVISQASTKIAQLEADLQFWRDAGRRVGLNDLGVLDDEVALAISRGRAALKSEADAAASRARVSELIIASTNVKSTENDQSTFIDIEVHRSIVADLNERLEILIMENDSLSERIKILQVGHSPSERKSENVVVKNSLVTTSVTPMISNAEREVSAVISYSSPAVEATNIQIDLQSSDEKAVVVEPPPTTNEPALKPLKQRWDPKGTL